MTRPKTVAEAREAARDARCEGRCGITLGGRSHTVHQDWCPRSIAVDDLIRAVRRETPCWEWIWAYEEYEHDLAVEDGPKPCGKCSSCQAREDK